MADLLWRLVENRLRPSLPPAHFSSTMGDLAEEYAVRVARGRIRAGLWLLREARSLASAYAAARPRDTVRARMFVTDLQHAWRRLAARPGQPVLCATLLALGIGLSTAMFSAVDALLLRPAPFPGGQRLVLQSFFDSEPALMQAWRSSGMFEAVEAGRISSFEINGTGARRWAGASVTPGVFEMLRAQPLHGRTFARTDPMPGPLDEALISETLWRSVFGSDPTILGRRVRIDHASAVIVGVMPASFRFPTPASVVWLPLKSGSGESGVFHLFALLAPDVPFAAAEGRVKVLARELARFPRSYPGTPPFRRMGEPELSGFIRAALLRLFAGVGITFLVLCANVSSLLLANLSMRRRELAMCAALGASRRRLIREAVAEHGFIAIAGTALGVVLAWSFTSFVPRVFEGHTLNPIDLDLRALLAASGLGMIAVILTGMIPAWIGTRTDPMNALRGLRQAGTETRSARIAGRFLVIGEVALACSLLVGSTLLVRSFANLVAADRGLDGSGVLRVSVSGLDDAFGSYDAMTLATTAIEEHFKAWPAVREVALSREIPPNPPANTGGLVHLGKPGTKLDPQNGIPSDRYRVSAAFFDFYDIPIVRGRTFQPGDTDRDVIIGERLAGMLWPGQDPVGLELSVGTVKESHRVIGVAGEIRLPTLDPVLDRPEFYTPLGRTSRTLFINMRCRTACPSEAEISARVQAVHQALRARPSSSAEDVYLGQLLLPQATARVAGVFAAVALLTAAAGLFSVLTSTVGARRREFGIRAALGASPRQVRRLIVADGMSVVAIGAALGAVGGWLVARSLAAFQYGVAATDPLTWASVIGALAIASLAAAWYPARLAMLVDPVKLLREA